MSQIGVQAHLDVGQDDEQGANAIDIILLLAFIAIILMVIIAILNQPVKSPHK